MPRLDQAIKEVHEEVINRIEEEIGDEEGLFKSEGIEIKDVIDGDRVRTKPAVPSIWVFGEPAEPEHTTSMRDTWTYPIMLLGVVKDDNPDEGRHLSNTIAALARSSVIKYQKGRRLGLNYVQDVRSGRFQPSAEWLNEDNMYAAAALIEVIFLIKE